MVCKLPFTRNNTNYISDTDHDENSRKFWFLVFGRGLYTKKCVIWSFGLNGILTRVCGTERTLTRQPNM
jgi:hypothetical protein